MALVRQRMEQLNIGLRNEVVLCLWCAMRNLGLLLAGALDFDSVVFIDDDVVIDDPAFLEKAMYGLGHWRRALALRSRALSETKKANTPLS